MVHEKYVVTTRRRRNFARCRPPRVLFAIATASLTAAGLNSEIVVEKEKKKEEDGEKKAKATHAGWNNNHAEMKLHFGKLSAVCHLLTEATKRHFPTCSAPALEPQPPPRRSLLEDRCVGKRPLFIVCQNQKCF